jgi:hypothetical protein
MIIIKVIRGWRLVAQSVLPISHDTIIYGSCNATNTVHFASEISDKMKRCSEILNIGR